MMEPVGGQNQYRYVSCIQNLFLWLNEKNEKVHNLKEIQELEEKEYEISARDLTLYDKSTDSIVPMLEELGLLDLQECIVNVRGFVENCKVKIYQPMNQLAYMYDEIVLNDEEEMETKEWIQNYLTEYVQFLDGEQETRFCEEFFTEIEQESPEQIIQIEVSTRYQKCSREILFSSENTLENVHFMIQKAFEFDNDHLYEFYTGKGIMRKCYCMENAVTSGDELSVEDIKLKDLHLHPGAHFEYLFDFGDCWWFDLKVKDCITGQQKEPEIVNCKGEAPSQYPEWEEYYEEIKVTMSAEVTVKDVLLCCDKSVLKKECMILLRDFEKVQADELDIVGRIKIVSNIILQEPQRILQFIAPIMQSILEHIFQDDFFCTEDEEESMWLSRLSEIGLCKLVYMDNELDEIIIPQEVKNVYQTLLKQKMRRQEEQVINAAEKIIEVCGVIEEERLVQILHNLFKTIPVSEIRTNGIQSRLCYYGDYYLHDCFQEKIISAYNDEITKKILDVRENEKDRNIDYPAFTKQQLEDKKCPNSALADWKEYVNFNLYISADLTEWLIVQIPRMAKSGVIEKEEILNNYVGQIHKVGERKSKKAEKLIQRLCEESPLATLKGNTKNTVTEQKEEDGYKNTAKKQISSVEYQQLSFEDMY